MIPFIDLKTQYKYLQEEIQTAVNAVLKHGQFILGPEITELENQLSEYTGAKHVISCSSGTDALLMPLMALNIGPGDIVFTTPFTFIATAEVISLLGAIPVFVDIDPETFNIDPLQLKLAIEAVKSRERSLYPLPQNLPPAATPKAIIPVDLFGLPADYDA
ncbi:DegT/DnrJ/EryC1/StrS family aminotransferase, partial [Thermodesulfobacteriota bacterium]